MSYYTTDEQAAMNRDARNMNEAGVSLAAELEAIRTLITSGSVGAVAASYDIDSVAKDGGHFSVDADTITGLTLGYKAGYVVWGQVIQLYAASTIALSASATNYIEADKNGTIYKNTSAFTAGRVPLFVITTGVSTITTITNAKHFLCGFKQLPAACLSDAVATKEICQLQLATLSANGSFKFRFPNVAGSLSRASLCVDTTIAQDNSNYWTATIVNTGPAGTGTTAMLDATSTANNTKVTGGSGITANIDHPFGLHGTAGNLVWAANDIGILSLTKTGTPANLVLPLFSADGMFTA